VIQTGTVPVIVRRGAFSCVFLRSSKTHDTLFFTGNSRFFGALAGKRAKKGVFITTSAFTREARDYANQVSDSIILLNGSRLARLMIEHGVGVTHRPLKVAQVDGDYFEELS
jgi:restriction system protein